MASGCLAAWMPILRRLPLNFAYSLQALTYLARSLLGASGFWVSLFPCCVGGHNSHLLGDINCRRTKVKG